MWLKMDRDRKNGDKIEAYYYEVRRRARWPGPFHEERMIIQGPWDPPPMARTRGPNPLATCRDTSCRDNPEA